MNWNILVVIDKIHNVSTGEGKRWYLILYKKKF